MPKQFVTIDGKRVAVSDITSKEKPFPFSNNFHELSIGEMGCDIDSYKSKINTFNRIIELNQYQTYFAKKTKYHSEKNINELKEKITELEAEITHRRMMAKKHKLRWGSVN